MLNGKETGIYKHCKEQGQLQDYYYCCFVVPLLTVVLVGVCTVAVGCMLVLNDV